MFERVRLTRAVTTVLRDHGVEDPDIFTPAEVPLGPMTLQLRRLTLFHALPVEFRRGRWAKVADQLIWNGLYNST